MTGRFPRRTAATLQVPAIPETCPSGEDIPVSSRPDLPGPASGRPARAGTGVSRTPSAQCRFGHGHRGPAGRQRRPALNK